MKKRTPQTVGAYIKALPKDVQAPLRIPRKEIRRAAPEAQERISYQIPTYVLHGYLVHFAAFKRHIGFYPTSSAISRFKKEFSRYETSKGPVRMPLGAPLPVGLIRKVVRFRVKQNRLRLEARRDRTR